MSSASSRLRTTITVLVAAMFMTCLWLAPAGVAGASVGVGRSDGADAVSGTSTATRAADEVVARTGSATGRAAHAAMNAAAQAQAQAQSESSDSDRAETRLRLIMIGLLVLAAVIAVVTVLFWRATRPDRS